MRPETAYRIINKAFKPFYKHQEALYPAILSFKNKSAVSAVKKLLEKSLKADREGDEYEETGMYYENCLDSESGICGQMFYISDRFNCTGRLKFLKRVLELY